MANAFKLEGARAGHEKVAGLLEKIDETTERATKGREELFAQLKNEGVSQPHRDNGKYTKHDQPATTQ